MRVMENGVYRDMTEEETRTFHLQTEEPSEPTVEERLARLEALLSQKEAG